MKLVPLFCVQSNWNFDFDIRAVLVPRYWNNSDIGPDRSQRSLTTVAGDIADFDFDQHRVLTEVREDLRIVDPHARCVVDLNFSDNAVPRSAHRIRNAV